MVCEGVSLDNRVGDDGGESCERERGVGGVQDVGF